MTIASSRLLEPVPAPRLREAAGSGWNSGGPLVMVVSESPLMRLAMGRELAPAFGLIHAQGIGSAGRRMELGATPAAVVVDLDSVERAGSYAFLARLVERDFAGPRVLVSSRLSPDLAEAFRGSCRTHFALARPWRPGALRALMESVLGASAPLRAAPGR
ncbi:hypothetical protein [Myxococcus stipitatus]|uniref:hypothetical protein n=1 Tax=Myxococcus stipitatus TaxID=83455 RepID=UPI0030CDDAD9